MSRLLNDMAAYVPPTLLRRLQIVPPLTESASADRFEAAVLFADVSGFTALTEALAEKGVEGPEEMTRLLNSYFERVVTLLEAEGGEVVKFSGDALTVLFPALDESLSHAVRRAYQGATAVQDAMNDLTTVQSSAGPVHLGLKIGVGAGDVIAMQVGGRRERWEYVVAGPALEHAASAEGQAARGEVALSPEAAALLPPDSLPPRPFIHESWDTVTADEALVQRMRHFVPGIVKTWLDQGLRDWLAVLRPMSVLFIGVSGLHYDHDEDVAHLHELVRAAQEIIYRYEGSINKVAVDDKGTIILALLGVPPLAHEDDPERAVLCALDLAAMGTKRAEPIAIGVATGRVFAGPVGSDARREYTVMGDTVNLAARLMGKAAAAGGGIRCDFATYRLTRREIAYENLPSVRLKGKAGMVRLYRPTGPAGSRAAGARHSTVLVGRHAEREQVSELLAEVSGGVGRLLLIGGEAGIGKTRLFQELAALAQQRGLSGLLGSGSSIEQHTPYRAWGDILASYFEVDEVTNPARRRRLIRQVIADVAPAQLPRLPLLNDLLNVSFPETALTASLEPALRPQNLLLLVEALLLAWTRERPLLLVLEDAHWLDPSSWDLTVQVARSLQVASAPFLLTIVLRPADAGSPATLALDRLRELSAVREIHLEQMTPADIETLLARLLRLQEERLPPSLADLVHERAQGNPFFAQELVYNLVERGLVSLEATENDKQRCALAGDLALAYQALPTTVHGLILARIDRLLPERQLALRVAAVIGRTFTYGLLAHTLRQEMEPVVAALRDHLEALERRDFTTLAALEPDLTYIFKHIVTHEVAYNTLLFAQRRQIHGHVAAWYETTFATSPEVSSYYPLLAYHYRHAELPSRELHYAALAGEQAARQYANETAINYFSRALELVPEDDSGQRFALLKQREAVYDQIGEREAQWQDIAEMLALAQQLENPAYSVEATLRKAHYNAMVSSYDAAVAAGEQALNRAEAGTMAQLLTEANILLGNVAYNKGLYDQATSHLQIAISLAQQNELTREEADALMQLAHVFWFQGEHAKAQQYFQVALETHHRIGNPRSEAGCLSSLAAIAGELGDHVTARAYAEQALAICKTIGYQRGQSIILTNLGAEFTDLGDYETAERYLQQVLATSRIRGNRWVEGVVLDTLGLVQYKQERYESAGELFGQALSLQKQIGDHRGQAFTLTHLGYTQLKMNRLDRATDSFFEALSLRRQLGEESGYADALAGLASVASLKGNEEEAIRQAMEVVDRLAAGAAEAAEYPIQTYLLCHDVFKKSASHNEHSQQALAAAYAILQKRAETVQDAALRDKYLSIPYIRTVRRLWEQNPEL